MISIHPTNTKQFMSHLFLEHSFDDFLLGEAKIRTICSFYIDGKRFPDTDRADNRPTQPESLRTSGQDPVQHAEQSESEYERGTQYVYWRDVRSFCLQTVRGEEPPRMISIVFALPSDKMAFLLEKEGITDVPLRSLLLNVRYDLGKITCTSAVSYSAFTLDKSAEPVWDKALMQFFEARGIQTQILS